MYLFVELGVVVLGLVRGLKINRVAGDRLRGHDADGEKLRCEGGIK